MGRRVERDPKTGDWCVCEQIDGLTYSTTGFVRKIMKINISRYAPYERAVEAARRSGLLEGENEPR